MQIPKDDNARDLFFNELITKCMVSREERSRHYATMRDYYLFGGSQDDEESPYNKVFPHIDLLTSFLFSADTTKFAIHTGAEVNSSEAKKIPILGRAVGDNWLSSNADLIFGQGVTWALVYNTMLVKLIPENGELNPFLIEPQCFGVLREDIPHTDRQEAVTQSYFITRSELHRKLEKHPHKTSILDILQGSKKELNYEMSGLDRIIILHPQPNSQGNVNINLTDRTRFIPKVDEELIEMQELWVWDDEISDYRVVTRADNRVTIYDRKNIFLDGELPFVQICPSPLYNYYWGSSEVDRLSGLQRWRNERIAQMRELLAKQVRPPKSYNGFGIQDEKLDALNTAGGWLTMSGDTMAKVEEFKPEIPSDLFREIGMIDEMFAEQSGLQNLLQGKGESGVRSGRQTSELARLGSARIKKRSLTIEDCLEKLTTLYLKWMQVYDKKVYQSEDGMKFAASQFTDSYVVKVDGHSNSPLFVEDHKSMAAELLEAKAITRARFIEMLDPPGKEIILTELKGIEKKEEDAAKAQAQAEHEKEAAKHGGGPLKQVK